MTLYSKQFSLMVMVGGLFWFLRGVSGVMRS